MAEVREIGRSALPVAGARHLVCVMIAAVASQPAPRSFHSPDNCSHECEHQQELDAAYHQVRPAVVRAHTVADAARRRSSLRQVDRRKAWSNHPTDCTQRGQRRIGGGPVIDERPRRLNAIPQRRIPKMAPTQARSRRTAVTRVIADVREIGRSAHSPLALNRAVSGAVALGRVDRN